MNPSDGLRDKERAKVLGHFKARSRYYNISKKIKPQDKACQICGKLKAEFHHYDYSKWYSGYHLCRKHHIDAHNNPNILKSLKIKDYNYLCHIKK